MSRIVDCADRGVITRPLSIVHSVEIAKSEARGAYREIADPETDGAK